MNEICLIGYGNWGKALLKVMSESDEPSQIVVCTNQDRELVRKSIEEIFGGLKGIEVSNDLSSAFDKTVVIAKRAKDLERLTTEVENLGGKFQNCIITSKGFVQGGDLPNNVIKNLVEGEIAVLSGPNLASEILAGKAAVSTLASHLSSERFKKIFDGKNFRVETCSDIIGVQVCSILKNIFAIGLGIISGAFESENMKAAFIIRAFKELMEAIELFGGKKETAYTASGLGDLILTCYSRSSRNHDFGYRFITSTENEEIGTVEGYNSILVLEDKLDRSFPLCRAVGDIIKKNISLEEFKELILSLD